jgi:hypothetical protein
MSGMCLGQKMSVSACLKWNVQWSLFSVSACLECVVGKIVSFSTLACVMVKSHFQHVCNRMSRGKNRQLLHGWNEYLSKLLVSGWMEWNVLCSVSSVNACL